MLGRSAPIQWCDSGHRDLGKSNHSYQNVERGRAAEDPAMPWIIGKDGTQCLEELLRKSKDFELGMQDF